MEKFKIMGLGFVYLRSRDFPDRGSRVQRLPQEREQHRHAVVEIVSQKLENSKFCKSELLLHI
jgi:hypothetical protein